MKKSREGESLRDDCKDRPPGLEVPKLQNSGSWRVLWGSGGLCLLCLCGAVPKVPAVDHCQRLNTEAEGHLVRPGAVTAMQLQDSDLQETLVLQCRME